LTDNELAFQHPGGRTFPEYVDFCRRADFLIHDAEFTEKEYRWSRSWGHTVYTEALRLALEAKVGKFGLFHHNQERTDGALEGIVEDCRGIIGKRGARMECFALSQATEIQL
jgi:ribonuclease BN (tRNA processing enzyme)